MAFAKLIKWCEKKTKKKRFVVVSKGFYGEPPVLSVVYGLSATLYH